MGFVFRMLFRLALDHPPLMALLAVLGGIGGVVWYREQVKETQEAEKLCEADRKRGGSIWDD